VLDEGTGMAELAFRSWEGRNANVLNRPLIHIGCFLFTILTIESPRAFLSQRYGFESIDFILFFLRWGGRVRFDGVQARMSQAGYFSEFVKGTGLAVLAFRSWNCDNGVCALEEGSAGRDGCCEVCCGRVFFLIIR